MMWVLVLLASQNFAASMLMHSLEDRYARLGIKAAPQADAIVLLGGMVHPLVPAHEQRPEFLGSVDRLLLAEELMHHKKAPLLVLSGGNGLILQNGPEESDLLSGYLLSRGVPAESMLVESRSRNTAENAREVAQLASKHGWRRVLLVTSAFHMPRAIACFHKVNRTANYTDQNAPRLEVIPMPVDYYASPGFMGPESLLPTPGAMLLTTLALKEYLGFAGYWVAGYI